MYIEIGLFRDVDVVWTMDVVADVGGVVLACSASLQMPLCMSEYAHGWRDH